MTELEGVQQKAISAEARKRQNRLPGPLLWLDNFTRRLFDILASGLAILLLSPVFILIALLIKRDSPGPVLYRGNRMGRNGTVFKILKFRTMYENDRSYKGPSVTAQDDPRITPTGRWLRDTKLNELPQLWNVLKGEMSLVGPRPEDPAICANWPEPVAREILSVRPGLTSPASVLYRHEETLLQSASVMDKYLMEILPTKLRLDYLYVRNRTILTDLDVIFWTFVVLLPRLNNVTVPEYLLYWGPLSRFTARYLIWFVLDFMVSFIAVALSGVLWRLSAPLNLGWDVAVVVALGIAALFSLVNSMMGLNHVEWSKASVGGVMDLAISSGLVTLALFVVNLMIPSGSLLPPAMLVVSGMLAFFGFVFLRYRSRVLTGIALRWIRLRTGKMNVLGERVLIIGAGEVGQFATWLLRNGDLSKAFSIVGFVDDDPRRMGMNVDGVKVLGTTDEIPEIVERYDVGLIMFAIVNISPDEQERILRLCSMDNTRLILVPDLLDSLRAHFPTRDMDRYDLFSRVLRNTTLDKLTGVYNRNHFFKLAEQELPRSRRYGHPLSLIVFSVESKQAGGLLNVASVSAQVLKEVADRVMRNIREIDMVGRLGEFTFAVLLPETELPFAEMVAGRLQQQLAGTPFWTDRGPISLTVHYGVVANSEDIIDAQNLVDEARQRMNASAAAEANLERD